MVEELSSSSQDLPVPVRLILRLLEDWQLEKDDAASLLGFEDSELDYVSDAQSRYDLLERQDAKPRVANLLYIRKSLWVFFQDLEVENDWLREPQEMLDERMPLSLLKSGSMEDLQLLREFVDAMTGM